MQVYYFTAGSESRELTELENRIRQHLPALRKLDKLQTLLQPGSDKETPEKNYVVFPLLTELSSSERLVSFAEQVHPGLIFIFVSKEISASDYKRLVRLGSADWASLQGAPNEIADIISRFEQADPPVSTAGTKPKIMTFVASSGGVGNATLALETAIQMKLDKATRRRRICLLDLDLQTSHVCDYLDLEARLKVEEIVENPERLDEQLFGLFVSSHSSGIDVLAAPRSRNRSLDLPIAALDALFGMVSRRYDVLIIDLPSLWFSWTPQILSASDIAVVTGIHTVPGLRQIAGTVQAVRKLEHLPSNIVVALNRCKARLMGGVANQHHVPRMLGQEKVLYVRDDRLSAQQAANTGIPMAVGAKSSKISKDIRAFGALFAELFPATARN